MTLTHVPIPNLQCINLLYSRIFFLCLLKRLFVFECCVTKTHSGNWGLCLFRKLQGVKLFSWAQNTQPLLIIIYSENPSHTQAHTFTDIQTCLSSWHTLTHTFTHKRNDLRWLISNYITLIQFKLFDWLVKIHFCSFQFVWWLLILNGNI